MPATNVIPDTDLIRTLLIKPLRPFDATLDRLHCGGPRREAIADKNPFHRTDFSAAIFSISPKTIASAFSAAREVSQFRTVRHEGKESHPVKAQF
jgi:hypothetical protein